MQTFGPELETKLGRPEVEVGICAAHLFTNYGPPPAGVLTYQAQQPKRWSVQYGSLAISIRFELEGNMMTLALRRLPTLSAYVYSMEVAG